MRLLAIGDLHGDTRVLFELLDDLLPDGLLCVGDWGDPAQIEANDWREILDRVPTLSVFGNHDDLPVLATLCNRDGSPVLLGQGEVRPDFCGQTVAGVSGIWAKSHRLPHYVTDDDVHGWAGTIASGMPVDILLTHGCPLGIADRTPSGHSGGQRCFLDLLKVVRPRVHLCGHLHLAQHRIFADPLTMVFNTGALPDGHYVEILVNDAGFSAAAKRTVVAPPPAP